jgi:type IV pilus assembly protein PilB
MSIPHSILSIIPYNLAIEYFVLPFGIDEHGRIQALMAYPGDADTLQRIQLLTGSCFRPVEVSKDTLLPLITKHYGALAAVEKKDDSEQASSKKRLVFNQTSSTIGVVNDIIHEAIRLRASDIHLEPFEREMLVRFRVDGVLQEMMTVPKDRVLEITSRLKIMSRLNIAEKRRSQDGRIRINENGKNVDIRVSTMPTDFGEKIVLRLLDKSGADYAIDNIGMDAKQLLLFKNAIAQPNGIVLLTGPTGSGKTTTLYGVINYIRKPGFNISTIEDPIEYNITGVNQTQVNLHTGMTFAFSLRTLLRQDPDIIMVGEMRDQETAEIAIRASLTGHLVLSTLHTNDAPSAITRLVDMGIEPYLVSSSLTMVVAQRLVRKICAQCKCEDKVPAETKKNIGLAEGAVVYKGVGCSSCGYTGYKGRIGIFEVMPITETIRQLINKKAAVAEIRNQALSEGMVVLRDDALSKLIDAMTSIEEISRETAVIS